MIDALVSPFIEFSFMRRALVGCMAISLTAPPIGVFLVLRRMSLMGDAMGHALLPGAAIGYLLAGLSLFAMSLGAFAAGLADALDLSPYGLDWDGPIERQSDNAEELLAAGTPS